MLCCAITSSPIVGSSRNSTSGEWSSAAISSIFIRSPSDSSRTGWFNSRVTSSSSASSSRVRSKRRLDAVDLLVQAERFVGGQVPPELVLLAHHQREAAAIGVFAFPGDMSHHAGRTGGGSNNARKELERGGLARPVGAEKGDEFALLHRQVDAADGLDRAVLAAEQSADRGQQPLSLLVDAIRLGQSLNFDDGHAGSIIGRVALAVKPLHSHASPLSIEKGKPQLEGGPP